MLNVFKTLGDVVVVENPVPAEAATGSGSAVLFGIAAVLVVAAVSLIVVNVVRKTKK